MSNGRGRYEFANGDMYEGFFQEGRRWGRGLYVWKSGEKFNGQWKSDKMEEGEMTTKDGTAVVQRGE